MLPDTTKTTSEKRFLYAGALAVSETITWEQAASYAGCSMPVLMDALNDPEVALAVEGEVIRLRYTGELANLKAARLTDSMLEKLLATPKEEISTSLAMKLTELGLRFRDKSAVDNKPEPPGMSLHIMKDGDPDPIPGPEAKFRLIIDLRNKSNPPRVIEHGEITDA